MFDHVVLTASNEGQAEAYRAELGHRGLHAHSTPAATVVPDPRGRRVGSGLSTLLALDQLAREWGREAKATGAPAADVASLFRDRHVCIIHAGGDSKRLPAYAAHGKIFTPLPIDAPDPRHATLFDLLLEDFSRIPLPEQGRVVIATGDVYLDLGKHPLGFDRAGIVGVAWASSPDRGARHGVYRVDAAGEVTGFLHKPTPAVAASRGALRADGTVLVDTGVVCIDPPTAAAWLDSGASLVGDAHAGTAPQIDLYGDMLPAMIDRRELHGFDWRGRAELRAATVPTCPFLHIGSSRELLDVLTDDLPHTDAWTPLEPPGRRVRVLNSRISAGLERAGGRVLIESSDCARAPALAGDNILVGVPPELDQAVTLPEGWGVVCLPITDRSGSESWTAVCFGIDDDFKTPMHAGGTFGNRPLRDVLAAAGVGPEQIWPGATADQAAPDHTLWTARLWTPAAPRDLLTPIAWMLRGDPAPDGWAQADRLSLHQVMASVDHTRLLAVRDRVLGGA
ncbi:MAG: L-fucokinase [Phycisphaerales bacterium JB054]